MQDINPRGFFRALFEIFALMVGLAFLLIVAAAIFQKSCAAPSF